jgi:hypothetical protein
MRPRRVGNRPIISEKREGCKRHGGHILVLYWGVHTVVVSCRRSVYRQLTTGRKSMLVSLRAHGHWLLFATTALVLLSCLLLGASAVARPLSHSSYLALAQHVVPSVPYTICGTLSFASPVTYTANTRPRSSTTGYLNGDSNLDLVVTDYSANSVSVFLGNSMRIAKSTGWLHLTTNQE